MHNKRLVAILMAFSICNGNILIYDELLEKAFQSVIFRKILEGSILFH